MRIALLSDIHGNPIALDAVLRDARAAGADRFWILGDFVAIGPAPGPVLETVASLPDPILIRGNTDRYVYAGERPPPTPEQARSNPELVHVVTRIAASFSWTLGYVTGTGWLDWLAALPLEARATLPDGTRVLGVHAAPGTDDGEGVHPGRGNDELRSLVAGCDADVVFVGHTHEPMVRAVDGVEVVNLGSVSNPTAPDLRASYVLLDAAETGARMEFRRVEYDHAAFEELVRRSRHPATDFIMSYQRGERTGRPPHADHTTLEPHTIVELPPPRLAS